MGRIAASRQIAKDSWAVLRRESDLVAIPILSFVCTLATMAVVGLGVWASLEESTTDAAVAASTGTTTELDVTPLTVVVGIVGYLLITVVVTFFAAAMVAGAHEALTTGSTSLGRALRGAGRRIGPIIGWSLLTGTVGLVIQAVQERLGPFGDVVMSLVGAAWNIVTWLAVPVVVVEGTGPFPSLKRSAELFKRTWGENLVAQGGLGLLTFLAVLAIVVVCGAIAVAIPLLGIGLGVLAIGATLVVMSALGGIFRTALYLYAADGVVADGYSRPALESAFRVKSGRLR